MWEIKQPFLTLFASEFKGPRRTLAARKRCREIHFAVNQIVSIFALWFSSRVYPVPLGNWFKTPSFISVSWSSVLFAPFVFISFINQLLRDGACWVNCGYLIDFFYYYYFTTNYRNLVIVRTSWDEPIIAPGLKVYMFFFISCQTFTEKKKKTTIQSK